MFSSLAPAEVLSASSMARCVSSACVQRIMLFFLRRWHTMFPSSCLLKLLIINWLFQESCRSFKLKKIWLAKGCTNQKSTSNNKLKCFEPGLKFFLMHLRTSKNSIHAYQLWSFNIVDPTSVHMSPLSKYAIKPAQRPRHGPKLLRPQRVTASWRRNALYLGQYGICCKCYNLQCVHNFVPFG